MGGHQPPERENRRPPEAQREVSQPVCVAGEESVWEGCLQSMQPLSKFPKMPSHKVPKTTARQMQNV